MSSKLEIYYCPGCGNALKSYEAYCPMCHSEIRKQDVPSDVKDFFEGINKIRNKELPKKEDSVLKKIIGKDFCDSEEEESEFEEKKEKELIEYIKNYPINPSRESILTFLILISNNIGCKKNSYRLNDAWESKFKQVYDVAKISINDSGDLKLIQDIYDSKMKSLKENKNKVIKNIGKYFLALIILSFAVSYPLISILVLGGISVYLYKKTKFPLPKNKLWLASFIVLAVLSIYSLFNNFSLNINKDESEKIVFSDFILADQLPKINGKGLIYANSDSELNFDVYDVKSKVYYSYLKECQNMGYNQEEEKNNSSYKAFSNNGFILELNYESDILSVHLTKTKDYKEFKWPENEFTKLLPKPNSDKGEIIDSSEKEFVIEVANTSEDDYKKYIEACKENGFGEKINETDKTFTALNKDKYGLIIEYLGYNVIKITVSEPKYSVKLKIDCVENIILNKYDIDVYVDDKFMGDIDHGSNDIYELELSKGKHTIRVEHAEDYEIDGKISIDIIGDSTVELEVTCETENVKIKNKTKSKEETKKNTNKDTKKENKSDKKEENKEDKSSETDNSVYYSTNDSNSVKAGNKGIYSYIKKGNEYDVYLILDLDEKFVYTCCYGNGDDSCWKSKITSGDLNTSLVVTMYDNGNSYQEVYHFNYVNNPSKLILVDTNQFVFEFIPTDLSKALSIKNSRKLVDL